MSSARGAARLITDTLVTLRKATTPGMVVVRADSAYFNHDTIAAITAGRRQVLDHRPDEQGRHRHHRHHQRHGLDNDPLPASHLG